MFSNISWGQYLIGVGVVVIAYYATVLFLHRKSLRKRFSDEQDPAQEEQENDRSFDKLEEVVHELKTEVFIPAGSHADKSTLLALIKNRLRHYTGMQQPAYRNAVTNYIQKTAKEICGVTFSEDELRQAWEELRN